MMVLMASEEHPYRFPPPLGRSKQDAEGNIVPVMEPPFIECGHRATLSGTPVECIRRKGHPVRINYGHSNGYLEWAFD